MKHFQDFPIRNDNICVGVGYNEKGSLKRNVPGYALFLG